MNRINKITYKAGMLRSVGDRSKLYKFAIPADKIPLEVAKLFTEDNVYELTGDYGDPAWGKPIEYKWMEIEKDGKKYQYEIFNLAVLMFNTDDERIRRLMRCIIKIEDLYPEPPSSVSRLNEEIRKSKRKRSRRRK